MDDVLYKARSGLQITLKKLKLKLKLKLSKKPKKEATRRINRIGGKQIKQSCLVVAWRCRRAGELLSCLSITSARAWDCCIIHWRHIIIIEEPQKDNGRAPTGPVLLPQLTIANIVSTLSLGLSPRFRLRRPNAFLFCAKTSKMQIS